MKVSVTSEEISEHEKFRNAPTNSYWLVKSEKRNESSYSDKDFPPYVYKNTAIYKKINCFHLIAFKHFGHTDIHTIDETITGKPDGKHRIPKQFEPFHFDSKDIRVERITKIEDNELEEVFAKEFNNL